jgi:signal transduction histidine kinase
MWRYRNLPIRNKLTLLLAVIASFVLLLSSIALMVNDVRIARSMLIGEYTTLANVIAAQSAGAVSIAEFDPNAAQDVLADLEAEPTVVFGALYDSAGKELARHTAPRFAEFVRPESVELGYSFTRDGYLDVMQEVKLDGNVIGQIYLRATTDELSEVVTRGAAIAGAVFVVAVGIAVGLAYRLQHIISTPILKMANMAAKVSAEHDYSIRVEKHGNDELGTLCDGFNTMLAEIQTRDAELAEHRAGLEKLVQQRTRDLEARRADLTRANAELLRRNKELDDFAYVASHDLRSPLRAIDNLARWIGEDQETVFSETARKDLEELRTRVQLMNSLLEGLLAYSRIGRKDYAVEQIDTGALVQKISRVLDRPKTFSIQIVDKMPTIRAPRVPLELVFRNLLDNAIKHHDRADGQITVEAQDHGDVVEFCVRDDGPGIPQQHLDRIFGIFETLRQRGQKSGSGMGLALVKKTVESLGGRISVESEEGKGTTFRCTWPHRWKDR